MKILVLLVGTAALVAGVCVFARGRSASPAPKERAVPVSQEPPIQATLVPAEAVQADRGDVHVAGNEAPPHDVPPHDPCATVLAERDALREENTKLQTELLRLRYPEESPYGLFLRSYEGEQITDPAERRFIELTLADFPFFLRAGEATWLVERHRADDWKEFAETRDEAVIRFLGPQRILAEASPEWIGKQLDWYSDEEWVALFGTPKPTDGSTARR